MLDGQETFGVAVMEGDYALAREYSDEYYITVLDYPRVDDADIFDSMFAVTAYTASLARSMEIINALTCKSELRNILQYGVEGVHYTLNDDGAVVRKNNDYMMNINYTGNVLMAYPEEGMDLNIWRDVILQNQQALLAVTTGSNDYMSRVDKQAMAEMLSVSDAYFGRLSTCETIAEFEAYLDAATAEIKASSYYAKLTSIEMVEEGGQKIHNPTSLYGALFNWWRTNFDPNFNA
jgi:putative aldouronate transport system substrate-binding protein